MCVSFFTVHKQRSVSREDDEPHKLQTESSSSLKRRLSCSESSVKQLCNENSSSDRIEQSEARASSESSVKRLCNENSSSDRSEQSEARASSTKRPHSPERVGMTPAKKRLDEERETGLGKNVVKDSVSKKDTKISDVKSICKTGQFCKKKDKSLNMTNKPGETVKFKNTKEQLTKSCDVLKVSDQVVKHAECASKVSNQVVKHEDCTSKVSDQVVKQTESTSIVSNQIVKQTESTSKVSDQIMKHAESTSKDSNQIVKHAENTSKVSNHVVKHAESSKSKQTEQIKYICVDNCKCPVDVCAGKTFSNSSSLRRHWLNVHLPTVKYYGCPWCNTVDKDEQVIIDHCMRSHKNLNVTTMKEKVKTSLKQDYNVHYVDPRLFRLEGTANDTVTEELVYLKSSSHKCPICPGVTVRSLTKHWLDFHLPILKVYHCPKCVQKTPHLSRLITHLDKSHGTAISASNKKLMGSMTRQYCERNSRYVYPDHYRLHGEWCKLEEGEEHGTEDGSQTTLPDGSGLKPREKTAPEEGYGTDDGSQTALPDSSGLKPKEKTAPKEEHGNDAGIQTALPDGSGIKPREKTAPKEEHGTDDGSQTALPDGSGIKPREKTAPKEGYGTEDGSQTALPDGSGLKPREKTAPKKGYGTDNGSQTVLPDGSGLKPRGKTAPKKGYGTEDGSQTALPDGSGLKPREKTAPSIKLPEKPDENIQEHSEHNSTTKLKDRKNASTTICQMANSKSSLATSQTAKNEPVNAKKSKLIQTANKKHGRKSDQITCIKPGQSAGTKAGLSADTYPGHSAGTKPGPSADFKSGLSAGTKPGPSADFKSDHSAGTKPGPSADFKSDHSAGTKPGPSADFKSDHSAGTKPVSSADCKSGHSAGTKPGPSADFKSGHSAGTKPGSSADCKSSHSAITKHWTSAHSMSGQSAGTKRGSSVDVKPSQSANTKPGPLADVKPGESASTKPQPSADTNPSQSAGTKPRPSANTKPSQSAGTKPQPSAATNPDSAIKRLTAKRKNVEPEHGNVSFSHYLLPDMLASVNIVKGVVNGPYRLYINKHIAPYISILLNILSQIQTLETKDVYCK